MLQSASLSVPKTGGRSRFSKALPAVPPIDTSPGPTTTSFPPSISTPVTAPPISKSVFKALPNPRAEVDHPPPPTPLHNNDPRTPVQFTPLPPIPRKKPVGAATAPTTPASANVSGTPKMMIPRRPVGVKHQPQQSASEVKVESQPKPLVVAAGPQQSQAQPQSLSSQQQVPNSQQEQLTKLGNLKTGKQEQQHISEAPPVPPKSGSRIPESTPPSSTSSPGHQLSPPPQPHEISDSQYQQPLKSPADSFSSILSAYSRSSTASVIRSSDGTAYSAAEPHAHNQHDKYEAQAAFNSRSHEVNESVSTIADSFPPPPPRKSPSNALNTGADGRQTSASSPPPPTPSKNDASQRPATPPKPLQAGPELGAPSPPRQQIWRRRSIKGSRELADLRLDYSHGSTASTSSLSTITQKPLPVPKPSPIEGSPAAPDTNEAAPEPPAKDGPNMGNGSSKIDRLKKKFHVSTRSDDTTRSAKSNKSAPAVRHPPTPEYQREEEKTPIVSSFITPVSPASSPEPQHKTSPNVSKDLPQQPVVESANSETKPISRKAVPVANLPALQSTKSVPDLKAKGPSPSHEPMPPMSARPTSGRNSPAPGPHPSSGRNSPAPGPFPPRGRQPGRPSGPPGAYPPSSRASSARPSSRGSVRPGPRPNEDRWARSPTGDLCYRGRDGTLYPEMKTGEPDPKAMNFPLASSEIPENGTVFKPAVIKQSHHNCYHRHKTMLRRPNRRYPLACQVCDKGDTEDRFACNFCHLRLCEPCLKAFDNKGRDLQALMQDPPSSGTLSLSSPTRPGSALGLKVTT